MTRASNSTAILRWCLAIFLLAAVAQASSNPHCNAPPTISVHRGGVFQVTRLQMLPILLEALPSSPEYSELWLSLCEPIRCPCTGNCTLVPDGYAFLCSKPDVAQSKSFANALSMSTIVQPATGRTALQFTFSDAESAVLTVDVTCNTSARHDIADHQLTYDITSSQAVITIGSICPRTHTISATRSAPPTRTIHHNSSTPTRSHPRTRSAPLSDSSTKSPDGSGSTTRSHQSTPSIAASGSKSKSQQGTGSATRSHPPTLSAPLSDSRTHSIQPTPSSTRSDVATPSVQPTASPTHSLPGTGSATRSHPGTPSLPASASATHSLPPTPSSTRSDVATPSPTGSASTSPSASTSLQPTASTTPSGGTRSMSPTHSLPITPSVTWSLPKTPTATITPAPTPTISASITLSESATVSPPPTPTPSLSSSVSDSLTQTVSGTGTASLNVTASTSVNVTASETASDSASTTLSATTSFSASGTASSQPAAVLNVSDLIANFSSGVLANAIPLPATWEVQFYDDGSGNLLVTSLFPSVDRIPPGVARPIVVTITTLWLSRGASSSVAVAVAIVFMPSTSSAYAVVIPLDSTVTAPTQADVQLVELESTSTYFDDYRVYEHANGTVLVVGATKVFLVNVTTTASVLGATPLAQARTPAALGYFKTVSRLVAMNVSNVLLVTRRGTHMCNLTISKSSFVMPANLDCSSAIADEATAPEDFIVDCTLSNQSNPERNPFDNRIVPSSTPIVVGLIQSATGLISTVLVVWIEAIFVTTGVQYFAAPLSRPSAVIDNNQPGSGLDDFGNLRFVGVYGHQVRLPHFDDDFTDNSVPMIDLVQTDGAPIEVGPAVATSKNSSLFLASGSLLFQLDIALHIVAFIDIKLPIRALVVAEPYPAGFGVLPELVLVSLEPNLLLPFFLLPRAGGSAEETREIVPGTVLRLPAEIDAVVCAVEMRQQTCLVHVKVPDVPTGGGGGGGSNGTSSSADGGWHDQIFPGTVLILTTNTSTIFCCYNAMQHVINVNSIASATADDEAYAGESLQLQRGYTAVAPRIIGNIMTSVSKHTLRVTTLGDVQANALQGLSETQWMTTQRTTWDLAERDRMVSTGVGGIGDPALITLLSHSEGRLNETRVALLRPDGLGHSQWSVPLGELCRVPSKIFQFPTTTVVQLICVSEATVDFMDPNPHINSGDVLTVHLFDVTTGSHANRSWVAGDRGAFQASAFVSVITHEAPPKGSGRFRTIAVLDNNFIMQIDVFAAQFSAAPSDDAAAAAGTHDIFIQQLHLVAEEVTASTVPRSTSTTVRDIDIAVDGETIFLLTSHQILAFDLFPEVRPLWQTPFSSTAMTCDANGAFRFCDLVVEEQLCAFGGPCNVVLFNNANKSLYGYPSLNSTPPLNVPIWALSDGSAATATANVTDAESDIDLGTEFFQSVAAPMVSWRSRLYIFSASNWSVNCYHHMRTSHAPVFQWTAQVLDPLTNPNARPQSPFGSTGDDVEAQVFVTELAVLVVILRIRTAPMPKVYAYSVALGIDAVTGLELWRIVPSTVELQLPMSATNDTTQTLQIQSLSFIPDPSRASALWNENVLITQLASASTFDPTTSAPSAADKPRTLLTHRMILGIDILNGTVLFQLPISTRKNATRLSSSVTGEAPPYDDLIFAVEPLLLHIVQRDGDATAAGQSTTSGSAMQLMITGGFCYDIEIELNISDPLHEGRIVDTPHPRGPVATCIWSFDLRFFPTGASLVAPALQNWRDAFATSVALFQGFGSLLNLPPSWRPATRTPWEGVAVGPLDPVTGTRPVTIDAAGLGLHGVLNWTGIPTVPPGFQAPHFQWATPGSGGLSFRQRFAPLEAALAEPDYDVDAPTSIAIPPQQQQPPPPSATATPKLPPLSTIALSLASNNLVGLWYPSFVGQVRHLRTLDISDNLFRNQLPSFAGFPASIEQVVLANNSFTSGSTLMTSLEVSLLALSSLPNLRFLDLSFTRVGLHGVHPKLLEYLPRSLEELRLVDCGFDCPLPYLQRNATSSRLAYAPSLLRLDLSNNRFSGIDLSFTTCEELPFNLQTLDISGNQIVSPAPAVFLRNASLAAVVRSLASTAPSSLIDPPEVLLACNLTQFNASSNTFYGRLELNDTLLSMDWIDLRYNSLTGDIDVTWIEDHLPDAVAARLEANSVLLDRITKRDAAALAASRGNLTIYLGGNPFLLTFLAETCPLRLGSSIRFLTDNVPCTNLTGSTGIMFFAQDYPVCSNNSQLIWFPTDDERILVMNPGRGEEFMNCTFNLADLVRNAGTSNIAMLTDFIDSVGPCLPPGIFVRSLYIKPDTLTFRNNVTMFYYTNTENPHAIAQMATTQTGPLSVLQLRYDFCTQLSSRIAEVCSVSGTNTFFNLSVGLTSSKLTFQDSSGRQKHCNFDGSLLLLNSTTTSGLPFSFGNVFPVDTFLRNVTLCLPTDSLFSQFRKIVVRGEQLSIVDSDNSDLTFTPQICQNKRELKACPLLPNVPYNSSELKNEEVCTYSICAEARTFLWQPCGATLWTYEGFAPLDECISLESILRLAPDTSQQPTTTPCTLELGADGRNTCEQEAGRWTADAMTTILDSNGVPFFSTTNFDNYCNNTFNRPCTNATSTLVANLSTRGTLCHLVTYLQRPRSQVLLRPQCIERGTSLLFTTCDEYRVPIVMFNRTQCFGGLDIRCSACLPYLEPTANALPYAFLIISSTKDIIFILVGAYLLSMPGFRKPVTSFLVTLAAAVTPYNPREKDKFRQEIFRLLNPREIKLHELVRVSEEILGFSRYEAEDGEAFEEAGQGTGWELISTIKQRGRRGVRGVAASMQSAAYFAANQSFVMGPGHSAAVLASSPHTVGSRNRGSSGASNQSGGDRDRSSSEGPASLPLAETTLSSEGAGSGGSNSVSFDKPQSQPEQPEQLPQPKKPRRHAGTAQISRDFAPAAAAPASQHGFVGAASPSSAAFTANGSIYAPPTDASNADFLQAVREAPLQLQEDFLLYYQTRVCERQKRLISNPQDPVVRAKFRRVFEIFAMIWRAEQETEEGRAFMRSEEFLGVRPERLIVEDSSSSEDDDDGEGARKHGDGAADEGRSWFGSLFSASSRRQSAAPTRTTSLAPKSLDDDGDAAASVGALHSAASVSRFGESPLHADKGDEAEDSVHGDAEEMRTIGASSLPTSSRSLSAPSPQPPALPLSNESSAAPAAGDECGDGSAPASQAQPLPPPRRRHHSASSIYRDLEAATAAAAAGNEEGVAPNQHEETPPSAPITAAAPHPHQHHVARRQRGRSVMKVVADGVNRFVNTAQNVVAAAAATATGESSKQHQQQQQEQHRGGGADGRRAQQSKRRRRSHGSESEAKTWEDRLLSVNADGTPMPAVPAAEADAASTSRVKFADEWDTIKDDDVYTEDPRQRLDDQKALLAYALRELHEVSIMEPIVLREEVLDSRFTPQPWMLTMEFIYAVIFFLICVVQSTRAPGYSSWQIYQCIYFRFINSAVSIGMVVNSFLRRVYLDEKTFALDFFVVSSGVLILPVLCTHIIPGLLLYAWIPLLVLMIWAPLCYVMREFEKQYFYTMDPVSIGFRVIFRLGMTAVVTLMLQSSFNWAVLYYAKDTLKLSYLGVLRYEYDSRLWGCFIESRMMSIANAIQFISAFA